MGGHLDTGKRAKRFSFTNCAYDPANGRATLSYDVDGRELDEIITFPWTPWPVDASRQSAFFQALELLHLVAGISYFKAGLAPVIDTGVCKIDRLESGFLNELYEKGLREFAYVNHLDLTGLINFKVNSDKAHPVSDIDLPERALVAMGGGKDSLVCLKMLSDAGIDVQPACVGGSTLIGATAKAAGLPLIRIKRELSPVLTEMNTSGAWNGHVPVTAINSAILLCAGILYGYRYIVFANESSANEATLTDAQGKYVNHQYSKSIDFEKNFRQVLSSRVTPGIEYFSLLRPFSEIAITRRFSAMTEFHQVFSSCNRNFHQDGSHIDGRWCQDCPKCRFTALALAPFLTPRQLFAIQGADLLDQEGQLQGFKALCGLGEPKPFECVGSIAESRSAMKHLALNREWQKKAVVKTLAELPEIKNGGVLELMPDPQAEHCIPSAIMARIDAF